MSLVFTYDLAAESQSVDEANLVIAYYDLSAGQWIEIDSIVNTGANTVTAAVNHFSTFALLGRVTEDVEPPVIPPEPATFSIGSLTIYPGEVNINEPVDISILVTNTGGSEGNYQVTLKIDDEVEARQEVTIAPGGSEDVTFRVLKSLVGLYSVEVNGLTDSFIVNEEIITPSIIPPTTPSITPPTTPSVTPPDLIPDKSGQTNWWLIGGIIASVIAVGMIIWQVIRQRA
jgi:hypothetical protein